MERAIAWRSMSLLWKDGQFLDGTIPQIYHDDGGFTNGLAVFDSMLAMDGILMDARQHFDRLVHDAGTVLGIGPSWLPVFETMSEAWLPLLAQNTLTKGPARLRTTITGGISDKPLGVSDIPSVIITATRSGPVENLPPISCAIVTSYPRVAGDRLENCKRLDYTRALAARREAQAKGADDALLTNTKDDIACGTTSNLFIEENGILITPPLSEGVMAGITRAKIIAEHKAREEPISERRLRTANRIYLTNSFWGMRKAILV